MLKEGPGVGVVGGWACGGGVGLGAVDAVGECRGQGGVERGAPVLEVCNGGVEVVACGGGIL
eukprot:10652366-Alexandrium_andersonii.AAC.1